jgi:Interferon-induced 6-16 family
MILQDPFDKVLKKLGVYQHIQDMKPIPAAAVPVRNNHTVEAACCTQGLDFKADISDDVRLELALKFVKYIHPIRTTPSGETTRIRPISLILDLDGTVQAKPIRMLVDNKPGLHAVYPARFRIPPSMIRGLPLEEQVWRSEKFALGTLLYELYASERIFDGRSDDEVQDQYRRATTFPNLESLPALMQCLIYACWSAEFGRYFSLGKFVQYVEDNPIRFALQVTGAVVTTAALIAVPILGAIGFSSIGPVAGSVAAGWQASIGAVEAGSLFALCQSAAMGGAVAAGLTTTGVSGAAVALAASGLPSPSNLREAFIRNFREGPRV